MNCLFCKIVNGEEKSRKIYEDDYVIAILDVYPTVDGHTLIIPKKHYKDFKELDDQIILHMTKVAHKLCDTLMEKLNVKSFTFAVNYGERQAIKHFHLHLLPNYGKNKGKKDPAEIFKLFQ